ncbi:N-acetylmuramoyl-L-alanine amidase [Niallia nealsonii AAU1]|nr:N-acetylmuramoyl-L-alanine amidase [Niallia nealsonii AAU1]
MSLFLWPLEGNYVITSGFRTSDRPDHFGVDFDVPGVGYQNNVAILASRSGTVSRSYLSDSYGEVVFIKHVVEGEQYETVYAHMHRGSRTVKVGDKISQGQRLGYMGDTGQVTGQHLHFEIHKPEWNGSKSYAVNPIQLLGTDKEPVQPPKDIPRMKVWFPIRIVNFNYGVYGEPPNGGWKEDSSKYQGFILAVRYEQTSNGTRWLNIYNGDINIGWINANQISIVNFDWVIAQQVIQGYSYKDLSSPYATIPIGEQVAFIEEQEDKQLVMCFNKALWVENGFKIGARTGQQVSGWYVARIVNFNYGIYGSPDGGWKEGSDKYQGYIFAVREERIVNGTLWANLWIGTQNIGWISQAQLEKIPYTFLYSSRVVQAFTYRDLTSLYTSIPLGAEIAYLRDMDNVHQIVYGNKLLYVAKNFKFE